MERKQNCWENKDCDRGPGSARENGTTVCPAAHETRLNGIHGGINAGRTCWVVAGTMCRGQVGGTFAAKFRDCQGCSFYDQVKQEEHPAFRLASTLIAELGTAE
jgi:hypothetical protein